MKCALTADLHGYLPEIPECDLLLIAGDVTPVYNHSYEFQLDWVELEFNEWLKKVPAEQIVGIAGNHDFIAERYPHVMEGLSWKYLHDECFTYQDLLICGSPWTPPFMSWAFMKEEAELTEVWAKLPDDTDILITHGPPLGICDFSLYGKCPAGSKTLRDWVNDHLDTLKLNVYGHIHEAAGVTQLGPHGSACTFVNASLVNESYKPTNPVRVIEI